MLFYNFDYKVEKRPVEEGSEDHDVVTVVALRGYSSADSANNAKPVPEDVARVRLAGPEDVRSLGEPVLRALWNFKAKKPAAPEEPVDADLAWELLQPKPKKQTEKDLTPPTNDGNPAPEAGNRAGKKEKQMASKKKVATKKKAAKAKKSTGPRGEKTLMVKALLERSKGCTRVDILKATGWPAVSVPAMAKACGLKLRKDKQPGKPTVYFGS